MSLPHVILTVLCHHDSTGYDITKQFSRAIGHVWRASHQQVYRELNKLAEDGAVTFKLEPQDGKPDRKVYSITELGRHSLHQWYQLPVKHATERDEISAKLITSNIFNAEPMIEHMQNLVCESQHQLNHLIKLEKEHYHTPAELSHDKKLERLALRRNILRTEAWLVWAQEVLCELEEIKCDAQ
ncbi:MAG: PadR family transcriptional regulator [Enterovibrio sp.]